MTSITISMNGDIYTSARNLPSISCSIKKLKVIKSKLTNKTQNKQYLFSHIRSIYYIYQILFLIHIVKLICQ